MQKLITGDAIDVLRTLPDGIVQCCVTWPPYFGLRDYGEDGQIGMEQEPEEYIARIVDVFREVRRVLRDDGVLWLNLGDSYAGSGKGRNADGSHQAGGKQGTNKGTVLGSIKKTIATNCKPKDLIGIPWAVAFALRADGWYLRQDIIWHKPNVMPESVKDRCTKSHEYVFMMTKSRSYYFDGEAIREPCSMDNIKDFVRRKKLDNKGDHGGTRKDLSRSRDEYMRADFTRNRRSVWSINTKPYRGAHFAVFPAALVEPCIDASTRPGDIVLDPFLGSGTTANVAREKGRGFIGIDLNAEYIKLARARIYFNEK